MEWVVYLLLFSATLYSCVFIMRLRKKAEDQKMLKEIDQDFLDEFETDEEGGLTENGMGEMLDWLEELDEPEQPEQPEEPERIEGFEELKDFDDSRSTPS